MQSTTDPNLRSFVAYDEESHFPIQNLPFGVFEHRRCNAGRGAYRRSGARSGRPAGARTFSLICRPSSKPAPSTGFSPCGRPAWREVRATVSRLLRDDIADLRDNAELREAALIPVSEVTMKLPVAIGDYTDFYSSREHATNVGIMFRGKENALMPNWLHLPVAYHGRASSIVVSGTPVRRPCGQVLPDGQEHAGLRPSRLLDFELEMGFFIGPGNGAWQPCCRGRRRKTHLRPGAGQRLVGAGYPEMGVPAARPLHRQEFRHLDLSVDRYPRSPGTVSLPGSWRSPPTRCPICVRPATWPTTSSLRSTCRTARISRSNFRHLYWNMHQQLAHHTVTGCNVRPGDLMASGTISAPGDDGGGSLLELSWKGTRPVGLANGEQRRFLEDHDTVTLTGWCQGQGYRVGFGEVSGTILPSLQKGVG